MPSQHESFQRQTIITIWIQNKDWNFGNRLLLGSPDKLQGSCIISPLCCMYQHFTNREYVAIELFPALQPNLLSNAVALNYIDHWKSF